MFGEVPLLSVWRIAPPDRPLGTAAHTKLQLRPSDAPNGHGWWDGGELAPNLLIS